MHKFSGKTASSRRQMPNKKGARNRAPLDVPLSREILAKQLTVRELERLARLGAAVPLALDHAGGARKAAALFQDAGQVRLEGGQGLRDAVTYRTCLA